MTSMSQPTDRSDQSPGLVIAGASHCGVQSAFAARRAGFTGRITLLGDEHHLPYHRPPLSKDLLIGVKTPDQITLRRESAYAKSDIELRSGVGVIQIDRQTHQVLTSTGERIEYAHLLLATGARPRQLKVEGASLSNIHYLRSMDDVLGLQPDHGASVKAVIIGGGYIGLEAAASLRKLGAEVTIVEAMDRILQRVASPALSGFYTRVHREEGVDVITNAVVSAFDGDEQVSGVRLADGRVLDANLVVVGIGVIPNVELAQEAGLDVDNGILVDEFARTSDPHIYAAGDCARGFNELYQTHLRVESVQNANEQGRAAVKHVAGCGEPYRALPWFWSDQYDVKLQIAGLLEGADRLLVRGDPTVGRSFALCHLKDDRLLAVEAVNKPADFLGAKAPIIAHTRLDPDRLSDVNNTIAECILPV